MYGYIYLTTNLINKRMYVGKHKSNKYDPSYYGSGKAIKSAIQKYGIENFSNKILYQAETLEELNEAEKQYIAEYKRKYGRACYNIAQGGDGGDVISGLTEKEKNAFVEKMTQINRERCQDKNFRKMVSNRLTNKYADPIERKKQSVKIRSYWTDEACSEHSERMTEYYKTHEKINKGNCIPCVFELNGVKKYFESVKDLLKFLKQEYKYTPRRDVFHKLLEDGSEKIPFKAFFKRHSALNGMLIYYKQNESVETIPDECKEVG
jgi:group I intron endonuclease